MNQIKKVILAVLILVVFIVIGYGGWHLERWINWNLGYEDDVRKEIDTELQQLRNEIEELKTRVVEIENKEK
jgi:peptidoglycan hydrolase CwlO-like protein